MGLNRQTAGGLGGMIVMIELRRASVRTENAILPLGEVKFAGYWLQ